MDMEPTVAPKSNQLNADDLIAGPKTITITKMSPTGNDQQPVAVSFEGDNGKPYYPCKSMRRVMVAAWGVDGAAYVGRQMTLFRDPEVSYGGIQVGGIRISHMSHLEADLSIALTVTRAKRAPYKVFRLNAAPPPSEQQLANTLAAIARADAGAIARLEATCSERLAAGKITAETNQQIKAAIKARLAQLNQSEESK